MLKTVACTYIVVKKALRNARFRLNASVRDELVTVNPSKCSTLQSLGSAASCTESHVPWPLTALRECAWL